MNGSHKTPAITTNLTLKIMQIPPSEKIPDTLSELEMNTVYLEDNGKIKEFAYAYFYSDGTPLVDPIYIPANTQINVIVDGIYESDKVGVFGCLVQDKKTGQMAFCKFYDSNIPMAIPFKPEAMYFNIEFNNYQKSVGAKSVTINTKPSPIKNCKVTIFAQYTDTSNKQIIIPCDPEFDNEDGPDPY